MLTTTLTVPVAGAERVGRAPARQRRAAPAQRFARRSAGGVVAQAKREGKSDILVFEPMKEVSGTLQLVERAKGDMSLARQSYEKSLEDAINDQARSHTCCYVPALRIFRLCDRLTPLTRPGN